MQCWITIIRNLWRDTCPAATDCDKRHEHSFHLCHTFDGFHKKDLKAYWMCLYIHIFVHNYDVLTCALHVYRTEYCLCVWVVLVTSRIRMLQQLVAVTVTCVSVCIAVPTNYITCTVTAVIDTEWHAQDGVHWTYSQTKCFYVVVRGAQTWGLLFSPLLHWTSGGRLVFTNMYWSSDLETSCKVRAAWKETKILYWMLFV
jgi:hypothetical protein